ncbi:MAG: hypothetical protein M3Y09_14015 [Actinomycetota bacterium]|nr:hypothetical protein [Actinomycetota bacterium]
MATSTTKVYGFIEELLDLDDEDLIKAFPTPLGATGTRLALSAAASRLPTGARELDELIDQGVEFLQRLRSDVPALPVAT